MRERRGWDDTRGDIHVINPEGQRVLFGASPLRFSTISAHFKIPKLSKKLVNSCPFSG